MHSGYNHYLRDMNFDDIFTERRVGSGKIKEGPRSGFQRDFDRLIFSSGFRRLQNKTQVFPLPGTAFVHNRLTHSLEVASVGRSLGKMAGDIISQMELKKEDSKDFYKYELANVIAAGCLAHDIGNPAFGHSGETAISAWFINNAQNSIAGKPLRERFSEAEWNDLINFEGNANSIRILNHSFRGRFKGGYGLTYTTIASILKYPCESTARDKRYRHRKKYGFFQTEKEITLSIMRELNMIQESDNPLIFKRHPFVYLVEAADDICYNIVDMEDAHRLKILGTKELSEVFLQLLREMNPERIDKNVQDYREIEDTNEGIAFLRALIINQLVRGCVEVFQDNLNLILEGRYNNVLMNELKQKAVSLDEIEKVSIEKIYNHNTVVQVEIAGYHIMGELLSLFIPAILSVEPGSRDSKILKLIPYQFTEFETTDSDYEKVMSVLDFISGMTDEFATEMYRKLTGIKTPSHE